MWGFKKKNKKRKENNHDLWFHVFLEFIVEIVMFIPRLIFAFFRIILKLIEGIFDGF